MPSTANQDPGTFELTRTGPGTCCARNHNGADGLRAAASDGGTAFWYRHDWEAFMPSRAAPALNKEGEMSFKPPRPPRLPVRPAAIGLLIACLGTHAGAQGTTRLAPAIRDFDRENPAAVAALPRLLSQTGLYRNIGDKASRAISDTSVTGFTVNSALWSDGTHKERFISLLPGSKVTPTDTAKYAFPDKAVLIKNFLIDTVHGDTSGASRIFIETRFLVYRNTPARKIWSGISYRWNRDQSDAVLVDVEFGLDTLHNVRLNGRRVGKRWRYPSSSDCAACHRGDETTFRGSLGFITPSSTGSPRALPPTSCSPWPPAASCPRIPSRESPMPTVGTA